MPLVSMEGVSLSSILIRRPMSNKRLSDLLIDRPACSTCMPGRFYFFN